mgnify:CR=1 FL=1
MKITSDNTFGIGGDGGVRAVSLISATTVIFDQGSTSVVDSTDPANIRITPVKHWNGQWAWCSVKSNKWAGQSPHFLIDKADHFNLVSGIWLACWATSPDSDTWAQFDHVTIGSSDIEFYNDSPFPGGTIYISAMPMYPFSRVQRKVGEWSAVSLVGETSSSSNKIIGRMTSRGAGDGSGRDVSSLPLYGLKISNSTANTKNKIVLASYNHPSEVPGPYALEGALDWLLTSGAKQSFLLDWCDVLVYPCLNPQGVIAGYFRSCPQSPTDDHNRKWDDGTSGEIEEIDAYKTSIAADAVDVDAAFDFHSEMSDTQGFGSLVDSTDAAHVAFKNSMVLFDSSYTIQNSTAVDTFKDFIHTTFGGTLYISAEHGHKSTKGIADWKTYGENTLKALTSFTASGWLPNGPDVGSRDFNGSTDRIDWASVENLAGSPLTISLWVNLDRVTGDQYIFHIGIAADAAGLHLSNLNTTTGSKTWQLSRKGSTNLLRYTTAPVLTTGSWINLIATHDGVFTTASSINLYRNGVIETMSGINGATEAALTGKWSLGGRVADDLRNMDGKIAQVGVWNRVLSSSEISDLASGYSPETVSSSGLKFYFRGNTLSLYNSVAGGGEGIADGTTSVTGAGNGPGIIY